MDILAALASGGPLKFTNVRQKANYHTNDLKRYLDFLEKNGFISRIIVKQKWTGYLLTRKGKDVLRRFSELKKLFALA
jgi:predicted transcriptional regulator